MSCEHPDQFTIIPSTITFPHAPPLVSGSGLERSAVVHAAGFLMSSRWPCGRVQVKALSSKLHELLADVAPSLANVAGHLDPASQGDALLRPNPPAGDPLSNKDAALHVDSMLNECYEAVRYDCDSLLSKKSSGATCIGQRGTLGHEVAMTVCEFFPRHKTGLLCPDAQGCTVG